MKIEHGVVPHTPKAEAQANGLSLMPTHGLAIECDTALTNLSLLRRRTWLAHRLPSSYLTRPNTKRRHLATLNVETSVDLDPHPRHTRVLRQHDERIRAILKISLML
jgi:hypothetical protein